MILRLSCGSIELNVRMFCIATWLQFPLLVIKCLALDGHSAVVARLVTSLLCRSELPLYCRSYVPVTQYLCTHTTGTFRYATDTTKIRIVLMSKEECRGTAYTESLREGNLVPITVGQKPG